jgi:predicted DNA-binding protein (UPF0251 family)
MTDVWKHIGGPIQEKKKKAKITRDEAEEIRLKWFSGNYSQKQLAEEYGVHKTSISKIVNRHKWR